MYTKKVNTRASKDWIDELLSRAECFEAVDIGTRQLIIARLIDRVEVKTR